MRAIDADFVQDALTKTITEILSKSQNESTQYVAMGLASIKTIIDIASTLDVAPVRHSYWEEYSCSQYMGMDEEGEPKYRDGRVLVCHNYCCRRKTVVKSNYCPNCGAKMDAGQEDDSHGDNSDG